MASLQINQIQLPKLRDAKVQQEQKIDKGFSFTLLSHIEEGELQDTLKRMIEEITAQGDKLSKHMDIRDVRIYRTMIADFLGEVIVNSHKFSRENFLDKRGRHRVYGIVRVINQKVDELARELIRAEANHLEILEKVGEIEGLLLDVLT